MTNPKKFKKIKEKCKNKQTFQSYDGEIDVCYYVDNRLYKHECKEVNCPLMINYG